MSDESLDLKVSELAEYFGSVLLPRDRPVLVTKLKETADIRMTAMRNNNREALESSRKLYLVDPTLVHIHSLLIYAFHRTTSN